MKKIVSALLVAVVCFGIVASSPVLAKRLHKTAVKATKPAVTAIAAPVKAAPVKAVPVKK
ncbi:MAG: hypothetical protein NTZ10_04910 [Candidatus Saganbacteria bacterium]|nr:hypothetical protein [Candidatus Saganbacteria bacterium]